MTVQSSPLNRVMHCFVFAQLTTLFPENIIERPHEEMPLHWTRNQPGEQR